MAVKAIPDGYPQVIPYLCIDGAKDAIEFYGKVLGAKVMFQMPGDTPDKIGHAEIKIGDSVIMLSDPMPDMGAKDPKAFGGTPVGIHVYIEDVDKVHATALKLGATEERAVSDQFYGDRSGGFIDPWGHKWYVSSHVEDVPPDEMEKRAKAAMAQA